VLLGLATSSVSVGALIQDDFEADTLDLSKWQVLSGPDVTITQADGQVIFNRPQAQLSYLVTTEQYDPAVTPLTITGSAVTDPEGLAIWTRASNIGNTAASAQHVLDSGIRIPLWPAGQAGGWYDGEIIEKTAGTWPWSGLATGNMPGEEAYDWDFVVTDDGTTITATFTQSSDPNNTFTLTAESTTDFDTDYIAITVVNGYLNDITITAEEPEPKAQFSLGAVEDISIGNGPRWGPDSNSNGSGLEARDILDRRHVFLISYDISELNGSVSNVSLNNFSHNLHDEVNVYGVIEDLDLLEVESLTWNTAPGVQNDPTPELNSPIALDMNDLTDVLLTFVGPGEEGIRFSTDTSQALADFINSDTDGIITLLISASAANNQLIVRSREHSAGGTLLEGELPVSVDPGTDGLVAYYPLEGDALDSSGNGLDGVIMGDPNFVEGVVGMAMDLDGDGDYVDCGNDPLIDTISEITVSTWLNIRTIPNAWTGAVVKGENAWRLSNVNLDPRFHFGITIWNAPDTASVDGTTAVGFDEWHNVTGTFDGANINVYLDGVLDASAPTTEPIGISTTNMFIGENSESPGRAWDGLIDEVMIYNRALSEGEVLYLAGVRTPVDPGTDGLVASYSLEGDVLDASDNMLDGLIMGDPNFVEGVVGMAIDLDGIDDYVDCGTNEELNSLSEKITVATWVNIRSITTAWMAIAGKGETAWRLSVNNDTTSIHFGFTGGTRGWQAANSVTEIPLEEWHHVAGVYDNEVGATIYVDSVAETVNPDLDGTATNEMPFYLGENPESAGRFLDGMLDEVVIYGRALSEEEILYLAGK
jgi:hypothetical protein